MSVCKSFFGCILDYVLTVFHGIVLESTSTLEPSVYEKLFGSLSKEEGDGNENGNRPNSDLLTRRTKFRELIKFMKRSTPGSVKVAR